MYESLLNELCSLYGFDDRRGCALEDVIGVMERIATKNRAYLIIKFDGERATKNFTVAFSSADLEVGAVRMDADSLQKCMDHLMGTIVGLKREGKIQ